MVGRRWLWRGEFNGVILVSCDAIQTCRRGSLVACFGANLIRRPSHGDDLNTGGVLRRARAVWVEWRVTIATSDSNRESAPLYTTVYLVSFLGWCHARWVGGRVSFNREKCTVHWCWLVPSPQFTTIYPHKQFYERSKNVRWGSVHSGLAPTLNGGRLSVQRI